MIYVLEIIVTVERGRWEEGSCHSSEVTLKIVAPDTLFSGMLVRESEVNNLMTTKDDTNIIARIFVQGILEKEESLMVVGRGPTMKKSQHGQV